MGGQERKSKAVRLERLRRRMDDLEAPLTVDGVTTLLGVIKGLLELLEGEL